MVKRTPPLALGVIGTGSTSAKNAIALLNDYTAPYADVTVVLPVDDAHWSDTMDAVANWAVENDIPYMAVTDGSSPSKELVSVLEGAAKTVKVARVSTKIVSLLQEQLGEGEDAKLVVAWDDDDSEAVLAVQKALNAEIEAVNLCNGLDPFTFEDDDEDGEPAAAEEPAEAPADKDDEEATGSSFQAADDYDAKGVRALRAALRERDDHDLTDRMIGQLEKDDCIRALRNADAGRGKVAPIEERQREHASKKAAEATEAVEETRTTRARRAFAEGAAEGTGDEAQQTTLPRSKGSDLLDNEDGQPMAAQADDLQEDVEAALQAATQVFGAPASSELFDIGLRRDAVAYAAQTGAAADQLIPLAIKIETYLKGERSVGGRPRADGTPAQPREVGEDGKPVRRRASRSTQE